MLGAGTSSGCDVLSHPDRCLLDHLEGVKNRSLEKFDRISRFIDWEGVFGFSKDDVRKTIEISSLLHDIGKSTKYFQDKLKRGKGGNLSRHAPLSSLYTAKVLKDLSLDPFLVYAGYSIVRFHHGRLKTPLEEDRFENLVSKQLRSFDSSVIEKLGFRVDLDVEEVLEIVEDIGFEAENFGKEGYFLLKLLFSILVSSDREDVVLRGERIPIATIDANMVDEYVSNLERRSRIDDVRSSFQSEVRSFNEDGNILTITAPTGIGKTLANMRLALSVRSSKDGIVVYSLPLINIIEQTSKVAKEIFGDDAVLEYHHLSEPSIGDVPEEEYLEHLKRYEITSQTWSYPFVVTTFVSLLENLIGGSKAPFLHRLPGGSLILDEVQSIPHEKWKIVRETIEFLPKLGVKVILSTATMPSIFKGVEIVKKGNYFEKFNRVKISFENEMDIEDFKTWINEILRDGKSTLIITNTIRTAEEIFDSLEFESCFLSSRVLPIHRRERIEAVKEGKFRICVSTQVVEAGVDISFERVIRDIAPIDSIVQASGRCNRNFERDIGEVVIIPILENGNHIAKRIYGKFLVEKTLEILKGVKEMEEKDFREVVLEFFEEVQKYGETDEGNFTKALEKLDISKLDEFKLIEDSKNYTFLILIDEKSTRIFEEMMERSEKFSGMDRAIFVKSYMKKLSPYMVNTAIYEGENVGAFETAFGVAVIRGENVENWYDPIKGLRFRSGEVFI